MAMASKRRLTSTNDIALSVVVKFCVGLKLSPVETLKQIQNVPADGAHGTVLDIDLLGFSLPPHLPYSLDLASLDFHLFPDLMKKLNIGQWFETSLILRIKANEVFFHSMRIGLR